MVVRKSLAINNMSSKIAKKPVQIKQGVTVSIEGNSVKVAGPKGEQMFTIPSGITAKVEADKVLVEQVSKDDITKIALSGLTRALINNMVKGVSDGFNKKLELSGVGYRAQASGNNLTLSLGFSHPVNIVADPSIAFTVEENIITISGPNKDLVGNTAAKIRAVRPPEPYKGKGIKYVGEHIRRKVGKAAKAVGGVK